MNVREPQPLILVVEDSDDDAFFLERTLVRTNVACRRQRCQHGGQAVEYLQNQRLKPVVDWPMVMLLDLKMPVMSGFDVLRWLQQNELSECCDVVILSGSDQQSDIQAARELGASGYLVKPARVDQLQACLLPRLLRWQDKVLRLPAGPVVAREG